MAKSQKLSESLEDYLEVIFDLEQTQKVARAKDIADKMNVQRASVTNALKNLEEKGLVNYSPYSFITLTPKGKGIARDITERHMALKRLFHRLLKVDEDTAESTACRMEHALDQETLARLLDFFEFINQCPRAGASWIQAFSEFCGGHAPEPERCGKCIESCVVQMKEMDQKR